MLLKKWRKFARKHHVLPKTKQILLALAECAFTPLEILYTAQLYRRATMTGNLDALRHVYYQEEARCMRNALYALKRNKRIAIRKMGEKIFLQLTKKGKSEVVSLQCRTATPCRAKTFIIAIFDIPEQERHVRRQLRFFLREAGFRCLQKSVWRCDREVYPFVRDFIDELEAYQWVTVFRCFE